jgi:hypothetical protein
MSCLYVSFSICLYVLYTVISHSLTFSNLTVSLLYICISFSYVLCHRRSASPLCSHLKKRGPPLSGACHCSQLSYLRSKHLLIHTYTPTPSRVCIHAYMHTHRHYHVKQVSHSRRRRRQCRTATLTHSNTQTFKHSNKVGWELGNWGTGELGRWVGWGRCSCGLGS